MAPAAADALDAGRPESRAFAGVVRPLIVTLIGLASILRFVGLEQSPPGFFFDEAMGAAHSVCYQQTGRDLFGRIGLYSHVDFNNVQSAPFIMGGAVWTSVFGTGVAGFRSFIAFVGVLTLLGLYRLVRAVAKDDEMALWTTLFAACLPWSFLFSRISWDAPVATALLVWGLSLVYPPERRFRPLAGAALMAVASFTYTPMRVQAAAMVVLLPGIRVRNKLAMLAVFAAMQLALLPYASDPAFSARAKMLALISDHPDHPYRDASIPTLIWVFSRQFAAHFSPNFLLFSGDRNLRHSIQSFGMLDAVTFAGVAIAVGLVMRAVVRRRLPESRERTFVTLSLLGVAAGVLPAALTWSAIPHGVRALGAWPFFVMLAGYGGTRVFARVPRFRGAVLAASAVLFAMYAKSLFLDYPGIAGGWFDVAQVQQIRETRTLPDRYGEVSRAYYQMTVFGERCEDVRKGLRS